MVSRIDIGPDGGPYVEIDEDAGDLVIRVPNDTVDFDSNDLLNAVLQNATMDGGSLDGVSLASALDANNQDLNSVGTASVASLEAGSTTVGASNQVSSGPAADVDEFVPVGSAPFNFTGLKSTTSSTFSSVTPIEENAIFNLADFDLTNFKDMAVQTVCLLGNDSSALSEVRIRYGGNNYSTGSTTNTLERVFGPVELSATVDDRRSELQLRADSGTAEVAAARINIYGVKR